MITIGITFAILGVASLGYFSTRIYCAYMLAATFFAYFILLVFHFLLYLGGWIVYPVFKRRPVFFPMEESEDSPLEA